MGTNKTVMSAMIMKGASQSAINKALINANEVAKQQDPKKGEKKSK